MNYCTPRLQLASPVAGAVLRIGERNSFELLMINPRLKYWKPKKDGSPGESNGLFFGPGISIEDRDGDHGHSFFDADAGNGGNRSLAVAGPWVFARDGG
jgi:hypothetical protein